jgi:hypothetical protein
MEQKLLTAALILGFSFVLLALSPKPLSYSLATFDETTGKVRTKLEQSSAVPDNNKKSAAYEISGAKSSVRLKITEAVFQSLSDAATENMDPADYLSLYKLSVKKNRAFTMNEELIAIEFTSISSPNTYRVAPASGLMPGEYAFVDRSSITSSGNITVWTFGVDGN